MNEKTNIQNVNELAMLAPTLDRHTTVPLWTKGNDYDNEFSQMQDWQGVWNVNTQKVVQVVSQKFQLIQHDDVIKSVCNAFNGLGIDFEGSLHNWHDKVKADLYLKDVNGAFVDDGEKGIKLGVRVLNSNDRSCSFRLDMTAKRLVCDNGMMLRQVVPGVGSIMIHYGREQIDINRIEQATSKFIKAVISSSDEVKKVVDSCMLDSVEWGLAKDWLRILLRNNKHLIAVLDRLNVPYEIKRGKRAFGEHKVTIGDVAGSISRWDIYNALTNYLSHDASLRRTTMDYLEKQSLYLLNNKSEQLNKLYASPLGVE